MRKSAVFVAMLTLVVLGALPALAANGPDLGEGILAEVGYGGEGVEWRVFAEHESVTLTVSTPWGVVQRTYDAGKSPSFSLREFAPDDPEGAYNWQLRIAPVVDSKVRDLLEEARGTGTEGEVWRKLWREGLLPRGPFVQTGDFAVIDGAIVPPLAGEEKRAERVSRPGDGLTVSGTGASAVSGGAQFITAADQLFYDDVIITGSLCVGFDCINGESFGYDTIRLKENNLRIHADDTSTLGGFPNTDWRIEFNSHLSGGASYFRVVDASASRNIMTLEAGAPSNSLVISDTGRAGFGTDTPVVELHTVDGDTPTLRLQQDGTSGFAAQTWDLAGNETSFFIRDATNGSTLPFRIRPGASSNVLVIDTDDDVGIGVLSPTENLHIKDTAEGGGIFIETNGAATLKMDDTSQANTWQFFASNAFQFDNLANVGVEFQVNPNGDVIILGDLTANGTSYPSSRVLKQGFAAVDTRDVLQRLASIPVSLWTYKSDADHTRHIGPMTEDFAAAFDFLEADGKLNTIDLHGVEMAAIQALHESVQGLDRTVAERDAHIRVLEERLAALEAILDRTATGH